MQGSCYDLFYLLFYTLMSDLCSLSKNYLYRTVRLWFSRRRPARRHPGRDKGAISGVSKYSCGPPRLSRVPGVRAGARAATPAHGVTRATPGAPPAGARGPPSAPAGSVGARKARPSWTARDRGRRLTPGAAAAVWQRWAVGSPPPAVGCRCAGRPGPWALSCVAPPRPPARRAGGRAGELPQRERPAAGPGGWGHRGRCHGPCQADWLSGLFGSPTRKVADSADSADSIWRPLLKVQYRCFFSPIM